MTPNEIIMNTAKELGITIDSEFVPFSKSRNKGESSPSLNWKITIKVNDRSVLTTDYTAGCAHAPGHKIKDKFTAKKVMHWECENGVNGRFTEGMGFIFSGKNLIKPEPSDVISSLILDSSVIDYSSFEEWAESFGYDTDSRKGERVYRECFDTALKLRGAIGETALEKLRVACQDY